MRCKLLANVSRVSSKSFSKLSTRGSNASRNRLPPVVAPRPAEISRNLAHKVHRLVRDDAKFRVAKRLVASSRHIMIFPRPPSPARRFIPPRLAHHALLHNQIRVGHFMDACDLLEVMIKEGLRPHGKTLDVCFRVLLQTTRGMPTEKRRKDEQPVDDSILTLRPETVTDIVTSRVLNIFLLAREYHVRRPAAIYHRLIQSFLLQGEAIAASLLFESMIKDHNLLRSASIDMPPEHPHESDPSRRALIAFLRSEEEFDHRHIMLDIVFYHRKAIDIYRENEVHQRPFLQHILQSLAIIGMLLDRRQLPFTEYTDILRTFMIIPRVRALVWVEYDGEKTKMESRAYYASVLERFISSLPSRTIPPPTSVPLNQPKIAIKTYNTLLEYAMRDREDPDLANLVLSRLLEKQETEDLKAYMVKKASMIMDRYPNVVNQMKRRKYDEESWNKIRGDE